MFKRLWHWIRRKNTMSLPPELDVSRFYSKELLDLSAAYECHIISQEQFERAKERGVQKVEFRRWKPLGRGDEDAE